MLFSVRFQFFTIYTRSLVYKFFLSGLSTEQNPITLGFSNNIYGPPAKLHRRMSIIRDITHAHTHSAFQSLFVFKP